MGNFSHKSLRLFRDLILEKTKISEKQLLIDIGKIIDGWILFLKKTGFDLPDAVPYLTPALFGYIVGLKKEHPLEDDALLTAIQGFVLDAIAWHTYHKERGFEYLQQYAPFDTDDLIKYLKSKHEKT
jgi:hypothetical protein